MTQQRSVRTVCPRDCYGTCGLVAEVRDGRITGISGDPGHGATRGIICPKGRMHLDQLYHPDRLLHPRIRSRETGVWKDASWDEALDRVAGRLLGIREQYGSTAVFHNWDYGSMGVLRQLDQRFFNAFGGATNPSGSLCSSAGIAALTYNYGRYTSHDPDDLANSRFMILWGKNPADTSVQLVPTLKEVRDRGGRIVLIDPIRTRTAAWADRVLSPRPGTDGALALAVAHEIIRLGLHNPGYISAHVHGFDEFAALIQEYPPERAADICDIPAGDIRWLAEEYGKTRPAAILIGFGIQRYTNGGATVRAIDALSAITGNIGVSGGGTSYSQRNTKQYRSLAGTELARNSRFITRAALGRGISEATGPPIQAVVVTRSNPVCQSPDTGAVRRAFQQIPFVVVVDQFMTDTAEMADVVLPCATFLEQDDLYFPYWHNWIAFGPAVVEPAGEARPDPWIFMELAKRCGLGEHFSRTPREWLSYALEPMAQDGITLERLQLGPVRHPRVPAVPWSDGRFDTPSGRYELYSDQAAADGIDPLPDYRPPVENTLNALPGYPLQFLTTQPRMQTHSQLGNIPGNIRDSYPEVRLHPETAAARNLGDGQEVMVVSPRGSLRARLVLDDGVRHDVAATVNGHWLKYGGGINLLTPDYVSDMGLQAAFYDCLCDVRPAEPGSVGASSGETPGRA